MWSVVLYTEEMNLSLIHTEAAKTTRARVAISMAHTHGLRERTYIRLRR